MPPPSSALWPLLAAPFVGSLLGTLILRLPAGRPVLLARSACAGCGRPLGPRDLVPLLSFLALRGRCRRCGTAIAPFHWQIELGALAVAGTAAAAGFDGAALWCTAGFGWTLLALAWIDAGTLTLPDALTLPLLPAGLLVTAWLAPEALANHLLGAVTGFGALALVAVLYRRLRGRDGLGGGDAKLLGAIGAWIGLADLPTVLFGAAVAGLAWAAVLRLRGAALTGTTALPFGPMLALAGWLTLLWMGPDAAP